MDGRGWPREMSGSSKGRRLLVLFAAAGMALALVPPGSHSGSEPEIESNPPSIVLILTDDQR